MKRFMFKLAAVFLLSGATTFAGSFTSDFSNPNQSGYTLYTVGDPSGNFYPQVANGELVFLPNETGLGNAEIVFNDLDAGASIDTFTASFLFQLGPYSSSLPADGIAFAFGPDVSSAAAFAEDGPNMPGGGICVCFVTWAGDGPGAGVNVRIAGDGSATGGIVPGGYFPMSPSTMANSQMTNVWMQVQRNGMFNMVWGGQVIFTNLFLPGWSPVYGQFAFGGRNGGSCEEVLLNNINLTTTVAPATPVAPTITSQPKNVTVNEGQSASFSVGFDGDAPITFQWTENSAPITGATNNTLTLTQVSYNANNAKIACTVSNVSGTASSQSATMTVIKDTTPPTVTNAAPDLTFTTVTVFFDKPVSDTALVASNYKLNQNVTVVSVARVNQSTVALTTSTMASATTFTLTINNVQDTAATPNTIAPNTTIQFQTFVYFVSGILHKKYDNCNDAYTLTDFFADPRYPNNPDRVDLETAWEYPPNGQGRVAADPVRNYIDTLEGYFIPPQSGDYVFYICGDDEFYLYLSTDDTPANMYQIATEPGGWSDNRAWCTDTTSPGYHSGTAANWVSDTDANTAWPGGNTITLTQGKQYYMLAIHHDHSWSGGDWFGANFSGGGVAVPADGDASKLTGSVISYYFNPVGASIAFTQNPQSATVVQDSWTWLSVAAVGTSAYGNTVLYQWQAAPKGVSGVTWTNIPGGTGANVETPVLQVADSGLQYRVIGSMPPFSATSTVATVTVVANSALTVTAGAMLDPTPGTVDIGIGFSGPVQYASLSSPANYSVSSGTITSLTLCSNLWTADSLDPHVMIPRQSVLLRVTGFSGSGTVTVKNLTDVYNNHLTSTNVPITVATNMSWGVVGGNELGGLNAAVPVGPGAFDVYCDGTAEWNNYDETTFVYEKVTGNFDKKLRVEYQDGSSEWARAGICVRENTNVFGMNEATQEGTQGNSNSPSVPNDGLAGRYQKVHCNPIGATLTGPGTTGNSLWEGNRRLDVGGGSTSALTNANALPMYPNPWCRIQRTNQTFTIYRSADGVNWELLGQTVWGQDDVTQTPMPATVYVGPEFSPENGNISMAVDQGTFLAQFRDYGDYVATFNPQLTASLTAPNTLTITWTSGTLVSSPTVNGTYTPVTGASSPWVVTPSPGQKIFYRVKQ